MIKINDTKKFECSPYTWYLNPNNIVKVYSESRQNSITRNYMVLIFIYLANDSYFAVEFDDKLFELLINDKFNDIKELTTYKTYF